ncbi:MAG: phosphatidate cytidylyltransferase [Epsilonproteobacteria bacterium]|nr:phosphatidate cytidylyltransferase [Campylobacterota bacterium]
MSIDASHLQRLKSGAILLGVVILVGVINIPFIVWLFLGAIYLLSFWEAQNLFKVDNRYLLIGAVILWIIGGAWEHPIDMIFGAIVILTSIILYKQNMPLRAIFPFLYPTAGIFFIWMLYLEYDIEGLYSLLVIVALSDIGAYYIGKKFGKEKFSIISPNKTVEGVYGGLALGTIGGMIMLSNFLELPLLASLFCSLAVSLASIFGDLFESYLKREAGVKDSSNLIPGHGGILDRIDGFLFGSVILYLLLALFSF